MQFKIALCLIIPSFIYAAEARNLGTFGEIFEIKEISLLEIIQRKLHLLKEEGRIETLQKSFQEKAVAKINRPTPVEGLF